jgi:MarR family transcriptional regulator, organic hydroperoxide resistance regulator
MSKATAERSIQTRTALATRSWFAVVTAYQTCERQYGRVIAGFGLTIPQFEVLSAIAELGARATPVLIAQRMLVTKGNITGLLKRLSDQGLIRLLANPDDGRSQLCLLTGAASKTLAVAQQASAAFIAEQLAPFSDAELISTEAQMIRMRLHLEQIDTDALVMQAKQTRRQSAPTASTSKGARRASAVK